MKLTPALVFGSVDGECPAIELASLLACCLSLQAVLWWFYTLLPRSTAGPALGAMAILNVAPSQGLWNSLTELVKEPVFISLGIKWTPDENGVIAFDCRNRGW